VFRIIILIASLASLGCSTEDNSPSETEVEDLNRTTDKTLKISTWNIYWLVGTSFNVRTNSDYALLHKYRDKLNSDVIALQEIQDASFATKVFGSGYDYYFSSRPGGNGTQRVGFAVKNTSGIKVSNVSDYTDLDVGSVRYGKDITISYNNKSIRLMAVHLKSGCFVQPLDAQSLTAMPDTTASENKLKKACLKLANQIGPLEAWVDARAAEDLPYMLLGDFNRRFLTEINSQYSEQAGMWTAIDDPGTANTYEDLYLANANNVPLCWASRFATYIDQIALDPRALSRMKPNSFSELVYDETDYTAFRKILSDHCPLSIELTM